MILNEIEKSNFKCKRQLSFNVKGRGNVICYQFKILGLGIIFCCCVLLYAILQCCVKIVLLQILLWKNLEGKQLAINWFTSTPSELVHMSPQ